MDMNELKKQMISYWCDIYNPQYGTIYSSNYLCVSSTGYLETVSEHRIFRIAFLKQSHGQCCRISVNFFSQKKDKRNLLHGKRNMKRQKARIKARDDLSLALLGIIDILALSAQIPLLYS